MHTVRINCRTDYSSHSKKKFNHKTEDEKIKTDNEYCYNYSRVFCPIRQVAIFNSLKFFSFKQ